ncbi:AAA family ATPase [Candidatus Dependentiae bacterium]|nr:AAA family ATPase [Candidatus Dependentiae bacterium]
MKKLPIDVSTFSTMINENYSYIDKTEYIYNLIENGRFYFLSRPRRFGKSLLISTLKELFSGNKHLFQDLWIGSSDYNWQEHPIIHLNFSDLDIETSPELKISLSWELESIAQEYTIDVSSAPSAGSKLKKLVKELAKRNPVVILIDEYDYPLINNLTKIGVAQANRDVLKNFFSVIKSLDAYLKAIFITGVTKFSKTSIFSGLNNLNDLTLAPESALFLGYTQTEIDKYFTDDIAHFAQEKQCQKSDILHEMKTWYNGYRFSRKEETVYNPFSVLYYLKTQERANYWFESGTPSFLIEFLRKHYNALEGIEQAEFSSTGLGTVDLEDIPPITLLFQTGYLTISDYESVTKKYKLGYPNEEVQDSFQKYLLAAFSNTNVTEVEKTTSQLINALK